MNSIAPEETLSPAPDDTPAIDHNALGFDLESSQAIGMRLKDAREQMGISQTLVARRAKIRERYIEAIEIGNWDILPPGLNGRGLVRLYAKEVGVALPEFEEIQNLPTIKAEKQSESFKKTELKKSKYQPFSTDCAEEVRVISRAEYEKKRSHGLFEEDTGGEPSSDQISSKIHTASPHLHERFIKPSHTSSIVTPNISEVLGIHMNTLMGSPLSEVPPPPSPVPPKPVTLSQKTQHHAAMSSSAASSSPSPTKETPHHNPEAPSLAAHEEGMEGTTKHPAALARKAHFGHTHAHPYLARPTRRTAQMAQKLASLWSQYSQTKSWKIAFSEHAQFVQQMKKFSLFFSILFAVVCILCLIYFKTTQTNESRISIVTPPEAPVVTQPPLPAAAPPAQSAASSAPAPIPAQTTGMPTLPTPSVGENPALQTTTAPAAVTPPVNNLPVEAPVVAAVAKVANIEILEPVKVVITLDGKTFFAGTHDAGSFSIHFKNKADIYVEDGSKMTLKYGAWDHGKLGAEGRKRKLILSATPWSP